MPTEPHNANETNKLEDIMNNPYDDIINLPHHVSKTRKPMSMENRAAQFSSFAALSGHDDAIAETARLTSEKIDLSPDELQTISRRLTYAIAHQTPIRITYFQPDSLKQGGSYCVVESGVKKIYETEGLLKLTNNQTIPLTDIQSISIILSQPQSNSIK